MYGFPIPDCYFFRNAHANKAIPENPKMVHILVCFHIDHYIPLDHCISLIMPKKAVKKIIDVILL